MEGMKNLDNQHNQNHIMGTLQWFIFLLANSIALPIVVGGLFHLTTEEIFYLMQRTFFVVGISSFLQGWLGHRLPIADGPAGSWVGVFTVLAYATAGQDQLHSTLQILELGMIISGVILIGLGVTGFIGRILFLFTPLVTGTFLLLLCLQLSGVFLKGMLGITATASQIDGFTAIIAFSIFLFVIILSNFGKGFVKSYAVLIGLISGWILFLIAGKVTIPSQVNHFVQLPQIFAWGLPKWNTGMAVSSFVMVCILVSNTVAAIIAINQATIQKATIEQKQLKDGTWVGGISHIISSIFSTVGVVPLPATAGFIRLTKQKNIRSFLLACMLLVVMSLFPSIIRYLASLPSAVASAVLMASFVQLIGIGLNNIKQVELNERNVTILGVAVLFGSGVMFLPSEALQSLPSVMQYIFGNGLFVGTVVSILLEQIWRIGK
ncbi:purine/pyrimidine permease [Bacillus thuringiensis]|uniref:Purine/pyrimidine permease n=2 Tax=Bacillus thuringiensis TaxID=1428 RepID=A0A7D4HAY2_BACTU|nr:MULTISPECIES: purine/pyrimidine permease [Bacillus cereus group]EDX57012.1 xanthine/uracil permease family protein [Bacillus cereus W]MEB9526563.1 purine/pyrimidine permease [Bacillus anthracis]MEB9668796.1 purine/pyrimidine permease [Bacillus anthracis]MEC0038887.1 purine/pyrimidine permease [Bacillus anthracis]QKH24137.1 purine/pyrimidine permease [Bacillus thuringiensis]